MLFVRKNYIACISFTVNVHCCLKAQFTLRGVYLSFVCLSCSVFVDVHSVFPMARL